MTNSHYSYILNPLYIFSNGNSDDEYSFLPLVSYLGMVWVNGYLTHGHGITWLLTYHLVIYLILF